MELVTRIQNLEIVPDERVDIFHRPDPIRELVYCKDEALGALLSILWIPNYFFPLRYFTSWYRIFILVNVLMYLTRGIEVPIFSGAVWILGIGVPFASTVIFLYATKLRENIQTRYEGRVYLFYHIVMHILPSEILFLTTPVPHPPLFTATIVVVFLYVVYSVWLYLVFRHTILSNYYIQDGPTQLVVLVLWSLFLVVSCCLGEFLFAAL